MFVICAGMYRSGSTWQYNIASHLVEQHRGGSRLGFFNAGEFSAKGPSEALSEPDSPWQVMKTHDRHDCFARLVATEQALVVYSYRDLRDATYSLISKLRFTFEEVLFRDCLLDSAMANDEFWSSQPAFRVIAALCADGSLPNCLFEPLAEILSRLLIWARSLRLFLEAVAPRRHRSGQDQKHANAGSGCGIPLLGHVNNGPTQKEPDAETDEYSAEKLVPFHPKPSTSRDCSKQGGRLDVCHRRGRWLILSAPCVGCGTGRTVSFAAGNGQTFGPRRLSTCRKRRG